MHQPRRDAVISSVVALLCSLGHPAQAFWPSGGLVRQNMNAGRHQHRLESSSPAASTPLPATESSAGGGDAGADDSGEPSSPASHGRRTTWVQPFLPNTPSVSGATSATTHGRVGIVDSCSPLAAPAFVKRKAHYDMSVTAAAEPASPPPAVKVVLESSSSSEPASSADDGGGPPSPASHGRRTTWVQPFLPNAPSVSGATSAATHGRVGIVDSCSPLAAPAFVKRKVHYDMSVTAAAAEPASPPSAPKVAPESSDATASAATKTTAASRRTSSRRTSWIQPSHPPTPVDTTAAKSASDRVASSPSPPGIAPTFLNRPAFYDMSSSPVTAAAEPASPPSAAKAVSESPSPSPETSVTAEKTTTTPPPPSTDTVSESSSSSDATASVAAASAAADSSSAEEATPPPPAAKTASSPPPPVEFEPEPTLLSDSPVYQDVALTLKRAKETLAPFRKKIQDNVAEGNVGERGEEWALAQFAILLFVAMGSVPLIGGLITLLAGPGLFVGGIGVCLAGVKDLGASLSPWPAPIEDNELNTEGIYGTMRHPMYTGLVMCCLGFGVVTDSPLRMLLAVVLALVLDKKADKEEKMLIGFHGTAYEEYRKVVAKFVPRFY